VQNLPAELVNLSEIPAMSLRTFVSGSAVVLVTWLALSFQHRSIPDHYARPQVAKTPECPDPQTEESLVTAISSSP
jgi:hypothetical protein